MGNESKPISAARLPPASEREESIRQVCDPLPGSSPYDNLRPISVPQRCNGMTAMRWLAAMHTHYTLDEWRADIAQGRLRQDIAERGKQATGEPLREMDKVFAGQRFLHLMPDTVEPDVNADIRILFEEESLLVINKPAPLPIHPCGRFNLNTLTAILQRAFDDGSEFRIVHRLDASTTGVLVLCKTRSAAAHLSQQFKSNAVDKVYVARVEGTVHESKFFCDTPIGDQPEQMGKRSASAFGSAARTEFVLLRNFDDGSSLVQAKPITGRTNQIRIHLESLGFPVRGDGIYNGKNPGSVQQSKTNAANAPPLCLHALSITLKHPTTQERRKWVAHPPAWADFVTRNSRETNRD